MCTRRTSVVGVPCSCSADIWRPLFFRIPSFTADIPRTTKALGIDVPECSLSLVIFTALFLVMVVILVILGIVDRCTFHFVVLVCSVHRVCRIRRLVGFDGLCLGAVMTVELHRNRSVDEDVQALRLLLPERHCWAQEMHAPSSRTKAGLFAACSPHRTVLGTPWRCSPTSSKPRAGEWLYLWL